MNKKLVKLIKTEPVKLGNLFGFTKLSDIHNSWLKDMIFSKDDETLLAHRGSYKTTCLSVAIALLMIIRPNALIIFLRKTDDDVKEVIKQVGNILKTPLAIDIVRKLYDVELTLDTDTATTLNTNLHTSTQGATQLLGIGTSGSLTGKHADIIFTDDIVNLKDRVSKAERERIKTIYQELENVKNEGGRFFNTGTPWHKEDAIEKMPNTKRFNCYETGILTKEQIQAKRSKMTPSLFAANYELKHIADGDALFSNPLFFSNDELLYNGIVHIDASYGGADATALTIIKKVGDKFYVLGKRCEKHVDDCLSDFYKLIDIYRAGTIYVENNADKGYLKKRMINDGRYVSSYNEKMNKFIKISTYLRANWSNIYFHEATDDEYLNEILDYTEQAAHDDSADSLASAIRQLTSRQDWIYN